MRIQAPVFRAFKTLAAFGFLLFSSAAEADVVRGGLTASRFLIDPSDPGEDQVFKFGALLAYEHEVPYTFGAFLVGLGFEQRGGGSDYKYEDEFESYSGETRIQANYIVLPVGLKFENRAVTAARGYLAVRLVPSLILSAHGKYHFEDEFDTYDDSEDIKSSFNDLDLVGEVEGGFSFPLTGRSNRFLVGLSAGYGFFNVADDNQGYDENDNPVTYQVNSLVLKALLGFSF